MGQRTVSSTRSNTDLNVAETVRTISETQSGLEVNVAETITAVNKSQWNGVVDRSTRGSVFHRYEWIDAIETGLDSAPKHIVVKKDGNTIGVFPNFVVGIENTPFRRLTSIYPGFGGPLVTTDVSEALPLLIDAVPKLCSGRTILHEIRALDMSYLRYNDAIQRHGYRPIRTGCRFQLNLDKGYDAILDGMSSSRRRGIEKGREHDYELVEEEPTVTNFERFHRVYEQHMDRVGGQAFPMAFFEKLLEMKSKLLLVTLRIDGEYAGGMLELCNDEQSAVHGFIASIPQEYFEYHASELLYDYVIRWGIENGYETYDLGDTGTDFEDGVFRFKEGFGGQLVPNLFWERGFGIRWKLFQAGRSMYWRHYK
ncbi:GNAT family N-acetyltransferase [Halomontanus rarus]|uniref:GNAT family N-acetyltransferase n=1 Tax=Halomontanus rarus TaxID=3034020 RepID=UPI0023E79041|nr:GNAT family N-acetyltransferase [Halovivax sp. TS33]